MNTTTKIVTVFFYYMWNHFSFKECYHIWSGYEADHIWAKWDNTQGNLQQRSGEFFAELDNNNREKLVNRAIEKYNAKE